MIDVRVGQIGDRIESVTVTGHAGFANAGRDIVCAAVSILVYNGINSCEKLAGVQLHVDDQGDTLRCVVPGRERDAAPLQLLLQSMVFGLEQIAEEYPKHVRVTRYVVKE